MTGAQQAALQNWWSKPPADGPKLFSTDQTMISNLLSNIRATISANNPKNSADTQASAAPKATTTTPLSTEQRRNQQRYTSGAGVMRQQFFNLFFQKNPKSAPAQPVPMTMATFMTRGIQPAGDYEDNNNSVSGNWRLAQPIRNDEIASFIKKNPGGTAKECFAALGIADKPMMTQSAGFSEKHETTIANSTTEQAQQSSDAIQIHIASVMTQIKALQEQEPAQQAKPAAAQHAAHTAAAPAAPAAPRLAAAQLAPAPRMSATELSKWPNNKLEQLQTDISWCRADKHSLATFNQAHSDILGEATTDNLPQFKKLGNAISLERQKRHQAEHQAELQKHMQ
ncbi:hypothetical protein ACFOLJ_03010 [Rugamonas sp. CCM 8940]|uniref:hypothetical protein n=1 Tax=Rugamonas sp. CCM 8940 TaxID=2765359 RepID=UPI0018F44CFE|nr:hypothetical protein [Rugamonas sp. CCM 8940]MBJ7311910.1 hypothetical protein [Rugamonas sp. CCM 8940]